MAQHTTTMTNRHLAALSLGVLLLAGCATHPSERIEADGRYCFRTGDRLYVICTDEPVPPAEVESEVKRFDSTPVVLTVFIVRQQWADTVNRVEIRIDDKARVTTVPQSLIRLRLQPGGHDLALISNEQESVLRISGKAGEVQFLELQGSAWPWSGHYRWNFNDPHDARARALASRLIALVDLTQ
jgi:hypothetical protein